MQKSLYNAISNISQSFYDAYVEVNAKAKAKAGVKTVIIRRQLGHCCDWCAKLSGVYDLNDAPKDIYRRHDNCRCMVTVRTDKGTYVDAWSKEEFKNQKSARIARQGQIEIENQWKDIERIVAGDKNATREEVVNYIAMTTDVRGEYLKYASNHHGKVVNLRQEQTKVNDKDAKCANWLAERLGLSVDILEPKNKYKVKTPDFYVSSFKSGWEFKEVTSFNSIDKRLQDGAKQIFGAHCGIVLDINGLQQDISLPEALMAIRYRMIKRTKTDSIDVIVKRGEEFVAAYRYVKKVSAPR